MGSHQGAAWVQGFAYGLKMQGFRAPPRASTLETHTATHTAIHIATAHTYNECGVGDV